VIPSGLHRVPIYPQEVPFVLKDGIVVLGGYANTGNPTDQDRNWSTYKTILSGEVGNPFFNFDNLPNIVTGSLTYYQNNI
jgi:hypothetical protein